MARTISPSDIERAARLIREGGLVAFPTETVYGLGANGLDPAAVARIYRAKGRPAASPLILHADSIEMARGLAREWPEAAETLGRHYWPGPLTLVVKKDPRVPDAATAGLDTVGLRVPSHPVALALIRAAGVPVAAPSANRFTRLSPTTAEHVRRSLGAAVDFVLDGGPAEVGIESTVLSLAGERPVLLRPGAVTKVEIEALIGPVAAPGRVEGAHPAPGMHARHYSPATPLVFAVPAEGNGVYLELATPGEASKVIRMPRGARAYAATLYRVLHEVDAEGWDWIAVERPPDAPEWAAVNDRLRRAAARSS